MTEVNKPLESDTDDEILDDDFELEEDKEQQDETSVGATKDVDATQEFLTKVSEIAGRKFETIEDYEKHYKNLSSFVGKKVEPAVSARKPAPRKSEDMSRETTEKLDKIEFLMESPEAKAHFEEYIKPLAEGSGVSLAQAWEKVKPLVLSREEQEKEREIGVSSRNRVKPVDNSKIKGLIDQARSGNAAAQEAMVTEMLGLGK